MNKINDLSRDFISEEQRQFKFKIGKTLASSLSGFIAGVIFTSIFWIIFLYFL
jgi:dolichol kinase